MHTVALLGSTSIKNGTTQVVFVPESTEAPIWVSCWLATDWVQAHVRPGVGIVAEHAVLGKIETSYVDKEGVVIALKAPKQSITFRGAISVVVPESLPEAQLVSSDEAKAYVARFDAKKAQVGEDDPI